MEDGVKELKLQGLAGWVKKAPGRLLASYKDRFIHVDKTEVVVYENEDLQTCVERINLENYDRCHELKSPFKKRHRLILIRSNKSGNKVSDVKFQTPTAEEKEAWIKALTEAISRAKNKVLDEVKVDESSNLEHVTRTRPKGNRNRRPPTRIHMKEVAVLSSDGFLRLDLDLEDAVMPTGNHYANIDVPDAPREAVDAEDKQEEIRPHDSPKKNRIKPPMPPTKEAKPGAAAADEGDKDDASEKRVLMPPLPPSKETEEVPENTEKSPDAKKKAVAPPAPPNKPRPSSPINSLSEPSQTRLKPAPPSPPSKEKKPPHPAPDQEKDEAEGTAEEPVSVSLENINGDGSPCTKEEAPVTPKQTPEEAACSDAPQTEEKPGEREDQTEHTGRGQVPSIVCPDQHAPDGFGLSPLLCHLPGEKKRKAEEKSVDSGQHSDDDSEASGSEDTLVASTAALRGSHAELDSVDASGRHSDDVQDVTVPQGRPVVFPQSKPIIPLKPSSKVRSASFGDLLSGSSACVQVRPHARAASQSSLSPTDDVVKLESEVALEMEKTDELLSRMSQLRDEGGRAGGPEDLLAEAMEKLRKADHVLREVRKLKLTKGSTNRISW